MTRTRIQSTCFLFLLVLILFSGQAEAGKSDERAAIEKEFNLEMRAVRSENMLLPMTYLEVDGETYGYTLSRRFADMATSGAKFRIRDTEVKKNYLAVELESDREIRLTIYLFDVKPKVTKKLARVVFAVMLTDVFEFGESPRVPKVVVNTKSGLAHLGSCNHLPAEANRISFPDDEAALAAGHRLCPACFPKDPPLPITNYMPVRKAALEEARLYEIAFPLVQDQTIQDRVQNLGENLVDHLPFPAKGFPYRFRVVESEVMQGVSYPTGFVYLTDKLYDSVEGEGELAHVLAHEIIHCELHLPPNPQLAQPYYALPETWKAYFEATRWRETEADYLAISTVSRLLPEVDTAAAGVKILSKLQFANEAMPLIQEDDYSTHPAFGSRLMALKSGFFSVEADQFFEARDESGEWVCRLKVLGGGWNDRDEAHVHLLVELSSEARSGFEVEKAGKSTEFDVRSHEGKGKIYFSDGKKKDLLTSQEMVITPGNIGSLVFQVNGAKRENYGKSTAANPKKFDPSEVKGISLKLDQKVKWFAMPGSWF